MLEIGIVQGSEPGKVPEKLALPNNDNEKHILVMTSLASFRKGLA